MSNVYFLFNNNNNNNRSVVLFLIIAYILSGIHNIINYIICPEIETNKTFFSFSSVNQIPKILLISQKIVFLLSFYFHVSFHIFCFCYL